MRLVFMGTPGFAATALAGLIQAGHQIVAVYTQPPRPAHRGKQLTPSMVHKLADAHQLPVFTPSGLRTAEAQEIFAGHAAEMAVVAAYGLILPQPILDAPRLGCLNIHASLLPRWRGAAPIHRAIMAGDRETGITIMHMAAGLDTGPMLLRQSLPLADDDTTSTLEAKLADLGAALIVEALATYASLVPIPQPEAGVTYAHKIEKAEARLDFTASAWELERHVRAFNPSPGAWLEVPGQPPERLKILAAEAIAQPGAVPGLVLDDQLTIGCGDNSALRPVLVQRAGRQMTSIADLLRGMRIPAGTSFR